MRKRTNLARNYKIALLYELLTKQSGLCFYCHNPVVVSTWRDLENDATLDHKVPRSDGGRNKKKNLVVSCLKCNLAKGGLSMKEFQLVKILKKLYWPTRLLMEDVQSNLFEEKK